MAEERIRGWMGKGNEKPPAKSIKASIKSKSQN
jgi:hypothetical protein